MKKLVVLCGVSMIVLLGCAPSQMMQSNQSMTMPFDMGQFGIVFGKANWLYWYDIVAWWTSDSVQTESDSVRSLLGKSWFCYQNDNGWFAAYGRLDSLTNNFTPVLSYSVDSTLKVKKIKNDFGNPDFNRLARSLKTGYDAVIEPLTAMYDTTGVRFNPYVKIEEDSSISVWFLPGGLENKCIYGVDYHLKLNSNGDSVIAKKQHDIGLRYYEPNPKVEITLNNHKNEMPTVGNLFFILQFRKNFKQIKIKNANSMSTMLYNKDKKDWFWVHFTK